MKILLALALIIGFVQAEFAFAATTKKAAKKSTTKKVAKKTTKKSGVTETSKLSTDISFNDHSLHGRYQTPDEANARVENEKVLSDLLAVRTHFKDRMKKASEQN